MRKTDVAERLSQMVQVADEEGASQQSAVARQHTARGMLQSGNFFVAEKQALESIYRDTLHKMEEYALSVVAPSVAAKSIRTAGLELESKFITRFEGILGGSASGNPCPANASKELGSSFRSLARDDLNRTVGDAANNILGKPVRGWQGWVGRYAWNIINTGIALLAIYLSLGKR